MSDLGRLYQDAILEHHRSPRHAGRLDHPTHAADGNNPLCGDRVGVTLQIVAGQVRDVRCDVKGCAICRASGSMMAEAIIGRSESEVKALLEEFLSALAVPPSPAPGDPASQHRSDHGSALSGAAPSEDTRWGPLAGLLEARRFPGRRRCASLTWEVLQRALPP